MEQTVSTIMPGTAFCIYVQLWGRPDVWADASGITGYPVFHIRRKFVPWSAVATCEIETRYNTFLGKPTIVRPVLKGLDGKTLMMLSLINTTLEDQERLVKYIRAKLPKPKDDFWE